MSDIMRPLPFADLMRWCLDEYKAKGSVFGLDKDTFYVNRSGTQYITPFGDKIASAIGPAAGPHGQLAQNIIVSYLAGSRFIELKTVQVMDGETIRKAVAKPCINAEDEAYNCEWSTELTCEEAMDEYIKAWLAIKVLALEFELSDGNDMAFNMSVGYDLKGIQTPKVNNFIEGLIDASDTQPFREGIAFLKGHVELFNNVRLEDIEAISPNICHSIALSTLHGCPPDEIERIASYLIKEKHLDTLVKCNPTMLGYERVRRMLDQLGYDYIAFPDKHFLQDLQYEDAVPMFNRLAALAREEGLVFGLKLSNTCPVDVKRNEVPSEEMYMSGRSLMPLTCNLALMLSKAFDGKLPISYAGGADALNVNELLKVGIGPVTVATTVLKPGGYRRFTQMAKVSEKMLTPFTGIDVDGLESMVEALMNSPRMQKRWREKVGTRKTNSELPLFDCDKAPCSLGGCPVEQQIPEYNALVAAGDYDGAMRVIAIDNACPTITGILCAQPCREHCTRLDYDVSVHMRDVKHVAAEHAQDAYTKKLKPVPLREGVKVAVVGAGPGGIAAAYYLRRNGVEVDVYEQRSASHGIVRYAIPSFRISEEDIDRDYRMAKAVGVRFFFNTKVEDPAALEDVYDYVILATGAWGRSRSPVREGSDKVIDALEFLIDVKENGAKDLGHRVAIVGGGDVAMDAARTAKRMKGNPDVTIVYRRTEMYAPASQDEWDGAMADGVVWRELLAPRSYDGKTLVCERQKLGDFDESGRRACLGTDEYEELAFDTVIGATGSTVIGDMFDAWGLECDKWGNPYVSDAMESSVDGVYVIGDCRKGPSTVVSAMGDAKKAALDILEREDLPNDFVRVEVPLDEKDIIAKRGMLELPKAPEEEGQRCLHCSQVCRVCTEVCPNRANIAIHVDGFDKEAQIVHIDGFCNECGNCATFCPHSGRPYKDKLTLFWLKEDFDDSDNIGFLKKEDGGYLVRDERGRILDVEEGSLETALDARMADVILALEDQEPWLFIGCSHDRE
ncbi:MAG: putative selenate reductase subunit YgfK [Saccharofermentanales bacterium]|jgi:putative selenate reductase